MRSNPTPSGIAVVRRIQGLRGRTVMKRHRVHHLPEKLAYPVQTLTYHLTRRGSTNGARPASIADDGFHPPSGRLQALPVESSSIANPSVSRGSLSGMAQNVHVECIQLRMRV